MQQISSYNNKNYYNNLQTISNKYIALPDLTNSPL